jgi:4-hydroxybenzoate polyprenyltransferase
VIATLSLAYSVRLKATVLWGSAVVALLASSPISFGAATNGELGRLPLAAQATALAFMFTFEVVKTGVDVDGDRAAGVRTIATAHGLVVTARVAVAWSVACALAAVMTALVAEHPATYVVLMIAGVAPFLVLAIIRLLAGAPTPPSLRRALAPLRIAWFGGAAALLAL